MLTALVRKDLRLCRLPIIAGVLLLAAPFLMSAIMVMNMPLWEEATAASAWAVLIATGCHFSAACSQATLAMLSGSLIAVERADRSAEFLAYLPPSRLEVLGGKLIVLGSGVCVIWGVNLCLDVVAGWLAGDIQAAHLLTDNLVGFPQLAAVGMVAIGGGWCASACLDNTGPPVAVAFMSPLVVLGLVQLCRYLTGWPDALDFARVYFTSCAVAGIGAFLFGSVYYLRRVEP